MEATVRRRGGREPRYSVEEVLQAALDLIDAEGLQGFSMRRLADRLGIGPMTVYGYVRTREDVLDGVVGLALHGVLEDIDPQLAWEEQLVVAVRDLHDALRAHPGVLELLLAKPAPSPQVDLIREAILGILRRAGFQGAEAWEAVGMLASYAVGFASSQASYASLGPQADRLQRLPAQDFPHLSSLAASYPRHMSDRAFERGLAYLVAGLREDRARR